MKRSLVCADCPKWRAGVSVCLFRGVVMLAIHPACAHGRTFIKREYARKWAKRNRKDRES